MAIAVERFPEAVVRSYGPETYGFDDESEEQAQFTAEDFMEERDNIADTLYSPDFVVAIQDYVPRSSEQGSRRRQKPASLRQQVGGGVGLDGRLELSRRAQAGVHRQAQEGHSEYRRASHVVPRLLALEVGSAAAALDSQSEEQDEERSQA
ncbi:hypothetical protein C8T65DRAFT_832735 [Cerioporus squamosus]|nr:hypothetical protein C8T65DRAFT_832735 [Cerioporus squamosus]